MCAHLGLVFKCCKLFSNVFNKLLQVGRHVHYWNTMCHCDIIHNYKDTKQFPCLFYHAGSSSTIKGSCKMLRGGVRCRQCFPLFCKGRRLEMLCQWHAIQQWWSCFVSDTPSNSGGAALSVTSNLTVVEMLCQWHPIQQWWRCFVSDIQSNSGGAALSVTSNLTVVELLCRWHPIQQWWSCFVSDIQSNSGGAVLSVTLHLFLLNSIQGEDIQALKDRANALMQWMHWQKRVAANDVNIWRYICRK